MKRFTLLLTLIFCAAAFAQKNVAVLEIERRGAALTEISREEAMEITGVIRGAAVRTLPRGQFSVMTSETVQAMGGAVLAECLDETCVIALGRTIDAEYIVRGVLSKFQTVFTLNIEMFETEYGNLVATSAPVRSEKLMDILSVGEFAGVEMLETFLERHVPQTAPITPQIQTTVQPEPQPISTTFAPTPVVRQEIITSGNSRKLVLRLSAGALAVGGIMGGIIFNGMAVDEHDKFINAQGYERDARKKDAESLVTTRNLLYVLGGIGAAGFTLTFLF